ncbi:MAG TPA: hypothetical protein ENN49_02700 [Bacteroidales bacterium]|nr:hypothetical protein [Bacteroidales bacterium]
MKLDISYREIWRVAYPIILGSVAQNILNITDTAFLGRVGEIALGGGVLGGCFTMYCSCWAGGWSWVGKSLWQGV